MLELIKVSKHYHSGRFHKQTFPAVDNVSLAIPPGKIVGLVGESGSGKTTLGYLATHLLMPSAGTILLHGTPVHPSGEVGRQEIRRRIQIIFQNNESALNPRMTLSDLVKEPLVVHHDDYSEDAVLHLMDRVGLGNDLLNRYPHELSGGQRQRICIARAIALSPQYIIADEPAASLDYSVQAQILELLLGLQKEKGIGFLFISHHLKIIQIMADVVAVMYQGKIVEKAEKQGFFRKPGHPYTRDLLSSIPGYHRRNHSASSSFHEGKPVFRNTGCRYYPRCRNRDETCQDKDPDLIDLGGGHFVACHHP